MLPFGFHPPRSPSTLSLSLCSSLLWPQRSMYELSVCVQKWEKVRTLSRSYWVSSHLEICISTWLNCWSGCAIPYYYMLPMLSILYCTWTLEFIVCLQNIFVGYIYIYIYILIYIMYVDRWMSVFALFFFNYSLCYLFRKTCTQTLFDHLDVHLKVLDRNVWFSALI